VIGDAEGLQFAHDRHALGLDAVCSRVAATAELDDYYDAMDAFALTSREDPFPLVMLEAAVHGVPTVCFDGAGGGPEFVAGGIGAAVPYLDLDAFAQAVARWRADPAALQKSAAAARLKVRLEHGIESQGPKLLHSIQRCLAAA
jgi:glycosyltransferase involved in cell wall biosynthesis